jgi:hypothetical protein
VIDPGRANLQGRAGPIENGLRTGPALQEQVLRAWVLPWASRLLFALLRKSQDGNLSLMGISISKRSSEIPDEIYLAVAELGEREEFEGDWRVNIIPAPDNDDWTLSLESRTLHAPLVGLTPEHQSPNGVQRALHSMLEALEEES